MKNLNSVIKLTKNRTSTVGVINKEGWLRNDVTRFLAGSENVGIELGVAKGIYAKRMLDSNKFQRFYGVDICGDWHDTKEYCEALK